MAQLPTHPISRVPDRWVWGNPIVSKELRSSSRRRRTYLLRLVYVVLLTSYLVIVWYSEVEPRLQAAGSSAFRRSQMAEAGKYVISAVAWYQFLATQAVALILMSGAVIREVRQRTFGLLLTALLSARAIAAGKLLAGVSQAVVLVLISLPILMTVRVFGGVPWGYVVATTCVTLSAAALAGAIGLRQSVCRPRLATAVFVASVQCGGLYLLAGWFASAFGRGGAGFLGHLLPSPFHMMSVLRADLFNPSAGSIVMWTWPVHCAVLIALAYHVVARTARRIQDRADLLAFEPPPPDESTFSLGRSVGRALQNFADQFSPETRGFRGRRHRRFKPIGTWAIAWKDSRHSLIVSRGATAVIVWAAVILLAEVYLMTGVTQAFIYRGFHAVAVMVLLVPGVFVTGCTAAISIATEKESKCWIVLMTIPLSEWQILLEKAWGAIRRGMPAWAMLAVHVGLFTCFGFIHPLVWVHLAMIIGGCVLFLTATGVYMSTRIRRPALALLATLAVMALLWAIGPAVIPMVCQAAGLSEPRDALHRYISFNPFVQAHVVTEGASGKYLNSLIYHWPAGDECADATTDMVFRSLYVHLALGLVIAWRAKRLFRRRLE